jgi:hypothetical protein
MFALHSESLGKRRVHGSGKYWVNKTIVMAGHVPPARPKPLRRGEGPAIPVFVLRKREDVDARHKAGHDNVY